MDQLTGKYWQFPGGGGEKVRRGKAGGVEKRRKETEQKAYSE